jgi:hypothetical protein
MFKELADLYAFARPDNLKITRNRWRAFICDTFAIPFFTTGTHAYSPEASGRPILGTPVLTIDTDLQTAACEITFVQGFPHDDAELALLYMQKPSFSTPPLTWRNTALLAFRTTWDVPGDIQTIEGPTPFPFAAGQTLSFFLKYRRSGAPPAYFTYNQVAP